MADLVNTSPETLDFAEASPKGVEKQSVEGVGFNTFQTAVPYFVGSDLGIYNTAMSDEEVAEFIRTRAPLGYSPFNDFVAGEYQFRRAYIDFAFYPLDGADAQLTLTEAVITADVPDKSEASSGTVTVASTGLAVAFVTAFSVAPRVTVTPISSTVPLIPVLTAAPSTTGFTVKLFDLSGTAVTGTFIWSALGY